MFVKEHDQHNDLAFRDFFTLQKLYKFYYFIVSKIPKRCVAISLKSHVDPQIEKSQTL